MKRSRLMQMSAGLVIPSETLFYLAAQVFASAASSDANHYLKSYQPSRSSLLNSFNMGFITKQLFIHQPACSFSDWLSAHWFYFLGSDTVWLFVKAHYRTHKNVACSGWYRSQALARVTKDSTDNGYFFMPVPFTSMYTFILSIHWANPTNPSKGLT